MIKGGSAGHRVVVLVLDGCLPLDVAIPVQVFARREGLGYELSICGAVRGPVSSAEGLGFSVGLGLEALSEADTVVVPGYQPALRELGEDVLFALRSASERGARMVSICTGAFALAAAGLLDGRRATTHWQSAADLAHAYPNVWVDSDVLFVDEGQVLTSAGVAAGIDLCLHIVRRDHGVRASNTVARALVAAPYRSGGQAQFVPRSLPEPLGDAFAGTREWALTQLSGPLTLATLAEHARVSTRTFGRRFVEDTGYTPMQWVLRARIDLARELLERSDLPIEHVADAVGLGTGANLRLHFQRVLGVSPRQYRTTFAAAPPRSSDAVFPA